MVRFICLVSFYVVLSLDFAAAQGPGPVYWMAITEIMYDLPGMETDSLEFIEVKFNSGSIGFEADDFGFSYGVDFSFYPNIPVYNQQIIVIAKDSVAFENTFGLQAFQWNSGFSLQDTGGYFQTFGPYSCCPNFAYDNDPPWPLEPAGGGRSLEFCGGGGTLDDPASWQASQSNTGVVVNGVPIFATPGQLPACLTVDLDEQEESELIFLYPNPTTTNLTIESRTPLAQVWVMDVAGRRVITQTLKQVQGDHTTIDVSNLPSGIYLVEVLTQNGQRSVQKVVVE